MYRRTPVVMAKIYGLFGSMTGKVADVVMSVRNGEQIARKYQPIVSNPSTAAQVETRAKLKLMSQLSAVLAPEIAIPRAGTRSSRNLFVKKNYAAATFSNNQADILLSSVQLTDSVVGFVGIGRLREENDIKVWLGSSIDEKQIDRVVYVAVAKGADNKLRLLGSAVATEPGTGQYLYQALLPFSNEEVCIYAYGVRLNSETARAKFGDLEAVTAETIAKLVVNRTLTAADVTLTETSSATLAAATPGNLVNPSQKVEEEPETRSSQKK